MSFIKSDKGIILLLVLLFFVLLPFFFMRQGSLLIDTGREYYIPWQITEGEVLYKDIFNNLYGPFAYFFNAVIMYIFGQKLNILYYCGILNSLLIIITLYLLSREFLNKSVSFLYAALFISALVLKSNILNSNLPYSFSLVYALSSFLLSLLFIIKYYKNGNKTFAYLSCLFAGISIANKYEYIFFPLLILWVLLFLKPLKFKECLIATSYFLFLPIVCLLILLRQGLNYNDIAYTIELVHNIIKAPSLKIFYSNVGLFFDIFKLPDIISRSGILSIFAIIPVLNIILYIFNFNYKKFITDKPLLILFVSFVLSSAKSIFYLNVNSFGVYFFPICLLTLLILLERLKFKFLHIFLIACFFIFAVNDFDNIKYKNYKLKTEKGTLISTRTEIINIKYAVEFIEKNTKPTDKVVVLPEGCIINYITNRKGNNLYYNLNPLIYNDLFGEDKIISDFKKELPEYFIILPRNTWEYGSGFFLQDYAVNFKNEILSNYKLVYTASFNKDLITKYDLDDKKLKIKIYKRKDLN